MGRTKIPWTDRSWNPISGCTRLCRDENGNIYCYAYWMSKRLAGRAGYPKDDSFRPTFHGDKLLEPLSVKRPCKWFTCSMGDMFDPTIPDIWRDLVFRVMWEANRMTTADGQEYDGHIFQVLTKQAKRLPHDMNLDDYVPPNLWLGVTQDGRTTDPEDIIELNENSITPIYFVSCEPLLGPVKLPDDTVDWIIIGAKTGRNPMQPKKKWVQDLIDFADGEEIPIFMKNNLEWPEKRQEFPPEKSWRF